MILKNGLVFTQNARFEAADVELLDGKIAFHGKPEDVITTKSIQELYGIELPVIQADGRLCVMAV